MKSFRSIVRALCNVAARLLQKGLRGGELTFPNKLAKRLLMTAGRLLRTAETRLGEGEVGVSAPSAGIAEIQ